MRRRLLTILLAGLVVIITVPIGAAWTFERGPLSKNAPRATATMMIAPAPRTPAVLPDAAALMLTGGLLFGLAAIVRRTG